MRLLPTDPLWRGRAKLLWLAAFFLLPTVLSVLAYTLDWAPGARSNYGTLIAPRSLQASEFATLDGSARPVSSWSGNWVLLQFDSPRCHAACERKLYFMRQVRRALGREQSRVVRAWVLTEAGVPRAELLAAIEGTELLRARDGEILRAFPQTQGLDAHIYVIDPRGNLMMRYPPDPDPSRMLKDLRHLLKYATPQ